MSEIRPLCPLIRGPASLAAGRLTRNHENAGGRGGVAGYFIS